MKDNLLPTDINLYAGEVLENVPVIFPLKNHLQKVAAPAWGLWNFFQGADREPNFDFIKLVNNPDQADFFVLPHNYFSLHKIIGKEKDRYLNNLARAAKRHDKKIIVLAMADSDEEIPIRSAIIFRYSQYGYKKKDDEIITPFYGAPAHSPDFLSAREKIWQNIILRNKTEKPTVSFCGWAGFPSVWRRLTYGSKILWALLNKHLLGNKYAELHLHGIYWRRKALTALANSKLLKTNFIIRKSYSAQKDLAGAEKEYVENIINSDFVLCPKGNGNGSIRFFETLSLGRIPILINTDCILPLADKINYKDIVVSVDHDNLGCLEKRILEFYNSLSNEEFQNRQRLARRAFELLMPKAFFRETLNQLKSRCWV